MAAKDPRRTDEVGSQGRQRPEEEGILRGSQVVAASGRVERQKYTILPWDGWEAHGKTQEGPTMVHGWPHEWPSFIESGPISCRQGPLMNQAGVCVLRSGRLLMLG